MKTRLRSIYLLSVFFLLLSGCTKKNTSMSPDKKKAAAEAQKAADSKKVNTNSGSNPAPTPEPLNTPAQPQNTATTEEPATESTVSTTPSESLGTPPAMGAVNTPPVAAVPPTKPAPSPNSEPSIPGQEPTTSSFEQCLTEKSSAIVATLKAIEPREPTPANFLDLRNLLLKACESKIEDKTNGLEFFQLKASKLIVTETLKSFPKHEPIVKFFNAIENNSTFTSEQKENIFKAYGSGGEISSKDIHFYGKLEGSKASPNVISYQITSATGTRTTRIFTNEKEIKKTVTDLKTTPKPTNRYTFDFSPTQNDTYTLNISNGEAKLVVNVTFVKGDIKTLRERKSVIVALTSESWSKVQEEHLRRLIVSEAKELISMPFALEREQTNMALVRTCSLDADYIACTDPDFTSRAIVKASSKAK